MVDARWPTALVTGASAGLGTSFARQLVERGTQGVVLVARREERLRELADELEAAGATTEVLPADLTDADDLARVERRLADRDRPIDLLVNNAGAGQYGPVAGRDPDATAWEVALNVTAVTRLATVAATVMSERRRGAIVNVGSTAGFQPLPYHAVYGATKAFVNSFSQALHEEVRAHGVRVLVVCPGFVRTEFQEANDVGGDNVPDVAWTQPDDVVRETLDALDRGRAVVTTGALYRALRAVTHVSPDAINRRVAGSLARRL